MCSLGGGKNIYNLQPGQYIHMCCHHAVFLLFFFFLPSHIAGVSLFLVPSCES